MARRCFWPPESLAGMFARLFRQADPGQEGHGHFVGFLPGFLFQQHRGHGDVFLDRQVGEDVEQLEHHAHLLTVLIDVHLFSGDFHAFHENLAFFGGFQHVQAAQIGAFAAAGGADDADAFAFADLIGYALENVKLAKAFVQVDGFDHYFGRISHGSSVSFHTGR